MNGKLYFFDVVARKLIEPDYSVTTPNGKPALPMDCIELDGMVGYCMENQLHRITQLEKEMRELKLESQNKDIEEVFQLGDFPCGKGAEFAKNVL
jgi:hypothetical protein